MATSREIAGLAARLRRNPAVRLAFAALGLTSIYLIWIIKPAIEPSQYLFYHWSGPARNFFLPVFFIILAVWTLLLALLLLARNPGRPRVALWTALILLTPVVFTKLNIVYHHTFFTLDWSHVLVAAALLASISLTALWRPTFAQPFERALAPLTTILLFLGLFGVFILANLAWYAARDSSLWNPHPLHHSQNHPQSAAVPQPHRIIWIVFDELSQQQLFDHRFPGLHLPAFDALASQSTVFTDVHPIGIHTEVVLPALIAGQPFNAIDTAPRALRFRNAATGKWQPLRQNDTVFQDALSAGYSTALAGWYNPYCRILPAVLDNCFWISSFEEESGIVPSATVLSNTLTLAKSALASVLSLAPGSIGPHLVRRLNITPTPVLAAQMHIVDYKALTSASDKLLRDPSASFVLLHRSVPHPWGIYDRSTHSFTTKPTSYIDNLALADQCLATIRSTLEQTGQWDSSTIVLMGDHSWRDIQMWRRTSRWTPTDEQASHGGQYDPRPAFIVKLPGQTTGTRIDTPFQALNTRKLFDQLLTHKIATPAQLSTWAQSLR